MGCSLGAVRGLPQEAISAFYKDDSLLESSHKHLESTIPGAGDAAVTRRQTYTESLKSAAGPRRGRLRWEGPLNGRGC